MVKVMDEFMKEAIMEAKKSLSEDGIPIGSVLVKDGKIISRGHNRRVQDDDPLAHAEIVCMRNAGRLGSFRDTVIYSTLMPCYLCSGAIVQFGIKKVIAGESRNFQGGRDFMRSMGVEVIDLDLKECIDMMAKFIKENQKLWYEDIGK
jgi:cytosine deaminase